ncbi:MAG: hypothetical protein HY903_14005 [Deltaproteobacteria bacterium]|nr:hypothetical protein [Deltaproteobacteria bacterium]
MARSDRGILVVLGCAAFATACSPATGAPKSPPMEALLWPPPPEPPRVLFERTLPAVETPAPGFWSRVGAFVIGVDPEAEAPQRLDRPFGLTLRQDSLVVTDPDVGALWRIPLDTGALTAFECKGDLELVRPTGVAAAKDGTLYIADPGAGAVVMMTPQGRCDRRIGDGTLTRPTGVALFDAPPTLAVSDTSLHQVVLFELDGSVRRVLGRRGPADDAFNFPTHVAADVDGRLLVADALNFAIKTFSVSDGELVGHFGFAGDGPGAFNKVKGVAVDAQGHVLVADAMQDSVFIFDRQGVFLLAFGGSGTDGGRLSLPTGVVTGDDGVIYVADSLNRRVQVYRLLPEGGSP